jgi:hypothetical protein
VGEKNIVLYMKTKKELLKEGISRLRNLGFQMVDGENIFYDELYSVYFYNMLQNKKGMSKYLDEIIQELTTEIETKSKI